MKRVDKALVVSLLVVMALFFSCNLGWAGMRGDRSARVVEKLEALRNWKLMDVLNLSQERAEKIFMILTPFDKKREALLRERRQVRKRLVMASEGKAVKGDVRSIARRYLAIGTELAKLREDELRALEKELSPQEEAKYLIFVDRFHMEIMRMLTRDMGRGRAKSRKEPLGQRGNFRVPSNQ